ncbi:MAG: glycerophosphodiester phosphodiesterase [Thermoanaerobaculum sp.]|nr:glycerophosphodiester phosphodiesterase [Thermoanaerobaculum sp.]
MSRPLIIGHRGFAGRYPEISLLAKKAAVACGADGVEVDLRPCREGVWVCHHDRKRHGRPLTSWSLADLRREEVPPLALVLEAVPEDRFLFLEVKPLSTRALLPLVDPLVRLVEGRARLRVLSSSLAVLAVLRMALPAAPCSWVVTRVPERLPPGLELSPHHRLVESLRHLPVPLHPWTVNRPQRLRNLSALGVASLTTNYPDRALEVLGA